MKTLDHRPIRHKQRTQKPNGRDDIFKSDFDIVRIITLLNAYAGLKISAEDTLLVFDEIQSAPQGITALKYFYQKAPQYQIIVAGSLLGINIHPEESPVV